MIRQHMIKWLSIRSYGFRRIPYIDSIIFYYLETTLPSTMIQCRPMSTPIKEASPLQVPCPTVMRSGSWFFHFPSKIDVELWCSSNPEMSSTVYTPYGNTVFAF